jgi:hypothetical protein
MINGTSAAVRSAAAERTVRPIRSATPADTGAYPATRKQNPISEPISSMRA